MYNQPVAMALKTRHFSLKESSCDMKSAGLNPHNRIPEI